VSTSDDNTSNSGSRPDLDLPIISLFPDGAIAGSAAKAEFLEALLRLMPRDLKFQDFMRDILIEVMKVVKSEAGSILEVDHENQQLFFRAVAGQSSDKVSHYVIPIGQGIVGHVAESMQPLVVHNVEENKVYLKSIQDAVGFEARNIVAVPIVVRGRLFGILELLNRLGEANYSPEDVELLQYLSELAAKAIEMRLMLGWAMQQLETQKKDAA